MDMSPQTFEANLLPPSATAAMRAFEASMRIPEEIWRAVAKVGDVIRDAPDEAVPFLIWEYGLEEVVPWVPDLRRVLREGRAWQRIRGTPGSIAQALSWIAAPLGAIEEDPHGTWWDLFQLELSRPEFRERLAAVVALTRLSQPAHTDVIRLYTPQYDLRAFEFNAGLLNGPMLLNDWSGVWLRPDWPKISFGQRSGKRDRLGNGLIARGAARATTAKLSKRPAEWRWNADTLDGPKLWQTRHARGGLRTLTSSRIDLGLAGPWPAAGWTDGAWGQPLTMPAGRGQLRSSRANIAVVTRGGVKAQHSRHTDWSGRWPAGPWRDGPWHGGIRLDVSGSTRSEAA